MNKNNISEQLTNTVLLSNSITYLDLSDKLNDLTKRKYNRQRLKNKHTYLYSGLEIGRTKQVV